MHFLDHPPGSQPPAICHHHHHLQPIVTCESYDNPRGRPIYGPGRVFSDGRIHIRKPAPCVFCPESKRDVRREMSVVRLARMAREGISKTQDKIQESVRQLPDRVDELTDKIADRLAQLPIIRNFAAANEEAAVEEPEQPAASVQNGAASFESYANMVPPEIGEQLDWENAYIQVPLRKSMQSSPPSSTEEVPGGGGPPSQPETGDSGPLATRYVTQYRDETQPRRQSSNGGSTNSQPRRQSTDKESLPTKITHISSLRDSTTARPPPKVAAISENSRTGEVRKASDSSTNQWGMHAKKVWESMFPPPSANGSQGGGKRQDSPESEYVNTNSQYSGQFSPSDEVRTSSRSRTRETRTVHPVTSYPAQAMPHPVSPHPSLPPQGRTPLSQGRLAQAGIPPHLMQQQQQQQRMPPQRLNGPTPHGTTPQGSHGMAANGIGQRRLPHGMPPHGMTPNGMAAHGMTAHGMTPNGMTPNGMTPHGMPHPHGSTPHHLHPTHGLMADEPLSAAMASHPGAPVMTLYPIGERRRKMFSTNKRLVTSDLGPIAWKRVHVDGSQHPVMQVPEILPTQVVHHALFPSSMHLGSG